MLFDATQYADQFRHAGYFVCDDVLSDDDVEHLRRVRVLPDDEGWNYRGRTSSQLMSCSQLQL